MGTGVGVGRSTGRDARQAGAAAARQAVEQAGAPPGLVLVFATVGYEQQALLDGVTSVTGAAPLAGCSGTGVITQEGSDESSHCVAVMAIAWPHASFRTALGAEASRDLDAVAARIATAVAETPSPRVVLVFPDGLKVNAAALLARLQARLPAGLPILGGSAGEFLQFQHTYQYEGGRVCEDAVAAVIVGGDVDFELVVSHGCSLLPLSHEVTDAEGGSVREFDHRPAWHVMREYLNDPEAGLSSSEMPYLCMAQPIGTSSGGAAGETPAHLIRVPLGLDQATGAMFFPGGLARGDKVVMARRDAGLVAKNATDAAAELGARRPGRTPAFALQFDCAGRGTSLFGGTVTPTLIDPVQRALGKGVPWLGFHSYGEIAPVGGKSYFHQYTMALVAFYAPG